MKACDVAVIGGGLLGAAFGWGLARRGLDTMLFDEDDHAIRTARGNFGLVWVSGKGAGMPAYARWSLRSARAWSEFADELERETGVDSRYHQPGGFEIALDDDELAEGVALMQQLRAEAGDDGYEFEIVDAPELKRRLPIVGDVAGATYGPHDGHCDPLRLLRALHTGFTRAGGDYRPWTRITDLRAQPGGGFDVIAENGEIVTRCERVVLAAGHGSRALGRCVGLDVPTFPDQGQVIVTEKAAPLLEYPTNYVRQTDDGSFLLGPSHKDAGFDTRTEPGTLQAISARCVQAFPLLTQLRVQRSWAAVRVMTPDGCPVYQQSDSCPGAFAFSCHSGVTLAAVHATDVCDWIEQGDIPADYRVFHPERFDVQAPAAGH